jgi:hypothetical protein
MTKLRLPWNSLSNGWESLVIETEKYLQRMVHSRIQLKKQVECNLLDKRRERVLS